jgi:ABC-type transport system involved in multi-copper enzyme maturation permease subunit
MNAILNYCRGPWYIAVFTWREGMRKKTLVGFLILSLLVIFGSSFMTAFLDQATVGDVTTDMDLKLIKDICVATIAIFGVLIAIFISASVVPGEVENKVIYTILSKPVRRFQYLLGKFIGAQMIIIINLALMGALFFVALYARQRIMPTLLLWSILLTYFQFLIVSAFTFAISCASTSAVLPTIGGLFIYLTGNLTEYLKDVFDKSAQSGEWLDALVGWISWGLYNILPNLQRFSLATQIVNGQPNDPPTDKLIPELILYGLVYAISGYIIAYWVFRRKEM